MKLSHLAATLIAAAALAGCGSTVKLDPPAPVANVEAPKPAAPASAPAASGNGMGASTVAKVDLGAELTAAVANQRVVYFDFDSDVVKPEFQGLIDKHAKRLNNDKKIALSLQGHTDERGGREYNLALGQRRAESVAKSLTLLGVSGSQLEAVSFGKERPAVEGHDEAAWSKNRRVELKDK